VLFLSTIKNGRMPGLAYGRFFVFMSGI